MGTLEDVRKLMQDFIAPELRGLAARLDGVEKRLDGMEKSIKEGDERLLKAVQEGDERVLRTVEQAQREVLLTLKLLESEQRVAEADRRNADYEKRMLALEARQAQQ